MGSEGGEAREDKDGRVPGEQDERDPGLHEGGSDRCADQDEVTGDLIGENPGEQ